MTTYYVEDYEEVTGNAVPVDSAPVVETKVIAAPTVEVAPATVAEVE